MESFHFTWTCVKARMPLSMCVLWFKSGLSRWQKHSANIRSEVLAKSQFIEWVKDEPECETWSFKLQWIISLSSFENPKEPWSQTHIQKEASALKNWCWVLLCGDWSRSACWVRVRLLQQSKMPSWLWLKLFRPPWPRMDELVMSQWQSWHTCVLPCFLKDGGHCWMDFNLSPMYVSEEKDLSLKCCVCADRFCSS